MNAAQKFIAILLIAATVLSLGIVALGIPASQFRNFLLTANWFAWALFVVSYPFVVLQSGFVPSTQTGSRTYRAYAPARFWTGLAATTLFFIAIFTTISFLSFIAWYRGA